MENKKNKFNPETTYKLVIKNLLRREFICEISCGQVFSEKPIDDSSRFVDCDDFDSADFYSTELDDILMNNQSVHISKYQYTIDISEK
jgi:hypothetical protein